MCKLLGVVGAKTDTGSEKKLHEFVVAAQKLMSATDADGFGYAAFSHDPASKAMSLYGQKWVDPKDAFSTQKSMLKDRHSYSTDLAGFVSDPGVDFAESQMGDDLKEKSTIRTIIAHARLATCDVVISNTHPFFDEINEMVLIHNGVISNHAMIKKFQSTCDSESILTAYVEEGVRENIKKIQQAINRLTGSYAVMILARNHDKTGWYVDIFKNQSTNLYVSYLKDFGCYVFATTDRIIKLAAKASGLRHGSIVPAEAGILIRLDAVTGELIDSCDFTSHVPYTQVGYSVPRKGDYYRKGETWNGRSWEEAQD